MVIGVEGNVHVGKTTYIKDNYSNFNIIAETSFKPELNNFDRQLYYISEEINKKNKLKDNTILDRTLLSTGIYCFNSEIFNAQETTKLKKIINQIINNEEIIIPTTIHYISYPYKQICENHKKLSQEKGTQNSLVDYKYYLKYASFFQNNLELIKIISNNDFRQIIEIDPKKLFDHITEETTFKEKIIIDDGKENNLLTEIMDILCEKNRDISKLENMLNKNPGCIYLTKIIFIKGNKNKETIYKKINKSLKDMSNITILDKNDNIDNIPNKPLLLIDLLYEIKTLIEKGEI